MTSAMLSPELKTAFPGLAGGWHYLDSAATAQKPLTWPWGFYV